MSRKIELSALALLASLSATMLAGCSTEDTEVSDNNGWGDGNEMAAKGDWKVCSDANGNRVADDKCANHTTVVHHTGGGGSVFLWAYLASRHAPAIGERIVGSTPRPSSGSHFSPAPSHGTSRGGFGSSAGRFGGGGHFSAGG